MTKCPQPLRITISFDGEESFVDPYPLCVGERASGEIVVEVSEEVEFRELSIGFPWETTGKGNAVRGREGDVVIAREGRWPAGSVQRFRFDTQAPQGPITYHGTLFSVTWKIEAVVDLPRKRDIRESRGVELGPSEKSREVSLGPVVQKRRELEAGKGGHKGLSLATGSLLLLVSVGVGAVLGWPSEGAEVAVVWGLFALGGLLVAWGFWGRLGRGRLGEPTVEISSTNLRRGDELRFNIRILPASEAQLRSLKAILECEERATKGSGRYATHRKKTVHEELVLLASSQSINLARGLQKGGIFEIPEDVPCTFAAPDNQVVWWLRIEADVASWPDWKEIHLLTVRP